MPKWAPLLKKCLLCGHKEKTIAVNCPRCGASMNRITKRQENKKRQHKTKAGHSS